MVTDFGFEVALDLDAADDDRLARKVLGHLHRVVGRGRPVERRRRRARFPRVVADSVAGTSLLRFTKLSTFSTLQLHRHR